MLTLCGFAVSNYYNKVKLALLEKGIPFNEELVMTGSKNKLPGGSAHGISGASQVDHIAASHARNAQDAPLVRR